MKRLLFTLTLILSTLSAKAMSYERAREEALYLTDKMAYELNLNDEQYEYAYEINLDYLMGLRTADDIYGKCYVYRNADLRAILYDWQWTLFTTADYFFRPVCWRHGGWFFPIYTFYARDYFYYSRPHFYYSYRGAHCRDHFHAGFYHDRRPVWHGGFRGNDRAHHNGGRPGLRPGMSANRGGGRELPHGNGRVEGNGFSFDVPNGNRDRGENQRGYGRDNNINRSENFNGRGSTTRRYEGTSTSRNYDRGNATKRNYDRGNATTRQYDRTNTSRSYDHGNATTRRYEGTSTSRNIEKRQTRNSFSGSSSRSTHVGRGSQSSSMTRSGGMNGGSRGSSRGSNSRGGR